MNRSSASVDVDPDVIGDDASESDNFLNDDDRLGVTHNADDGVGDTADLHHPSPNRDRLVADAMALAAETGGSGLELADLINRYWRLVADEDLEEHTPTQLLRATQNHLALAGQRLAGQLKLQVEQGEDYTALVIVTDDMPFLVDSVTAAVTSAGRELDLLVHPLVVVRREPLGALIEVCPETDPDDAGPDRHD